MHGQKCRNLSGKLRMQISSGTSEPPNPPAALPSPFQEANELPHPSRSVTRELESRAYLVWLWDPEFTQAVGAHTIALRMLFPEECGNTVRFLHWKRVAAARGKRVLGCSAPAVVRRHPLSLEWSLLTTFGLFCSRFRLSENYTCHCTLESQICSRTTNINLLPKLITPAMHLQT